MSVVRPPAVAGRFYPADPAELRATVGALLDGAPRPGDDERPRALIVPHAGYVFSGPVAATGYAGLRRWADEIDRVLLLGPCHRVAVDGIASTTADAFETPLGRVPVDVEALERLHRLPDVAACDEAHAEEHSLEVHLPFLQSVLGSFRVVPLVVGRCPADRVAEVLREFEDDPATLTVVSSDLSHFHDYDAAVRIDTATVNAIEQCDIGALAGNRACGYVPVSGLLHRVRERGWTVRAIDVRNSGDTAGDRDRVVGYATFVVTDGEPDAGGPAVYSEEDRRTLIEVARWAIRTGLESGASLTPEPSLYAPSLQAERATFVTLRLAGSLRGCMGTLSAARPLVADVAHNACNAAFRDPRFPALDPAEYDGLEYHVSVLSPPEELAVSSEDELVARLRPGVDGLILVDAGRRGTLLPAVWASLPDAAEFVRTVKRKAGLPADHWSETIRAYRYTAESFGG